MGVLSPVLWAITDAAFSGDPHWSAWVVRENWSGTLASLNPLARAARCLIDWVEWVVRTFSPAPLVVCVPGVVVLARRGTFTRELLLFGAVELMGYLAGGALGVAGFADRFVPTANLCLLLSVGAVLAVVFEAVAARMKRVALGLSVVIMVAGALALWRSRFEVARICAAASEEQGHMRVAAASIAGRIAPGDVIVTETRSIPILADELGLYPMVSHFRGAVLSSDDAIDNAVRGHPSVWIIAGREWNGHPVFRGWVKRQRELPGRLRMVAEGGKVWSVWYLSDGSTAQ